MIIRGPLGSGKTTIAKKLAKTLGAEYIAIDRIVDQHGLDKEKEQGYISRRSFMKANNIVLPKTVEMLDKGKQIIFDGNFYWRSQIEDLIKRLNFPHFIFTLKAPLEVCVQRDKDRSNSHGQDAAEAVYRKSTEFDYGTLIDVTKPVEQSLEKMLSKLPHRSKSE